MQRGQLRLNLTELLSTQVVSDLLAVLKPQQDGVGALASVRDHQHHVCGLPSVASSWQELLRTHGAAPGDCTARPRMPDTCFFSSRSRQAASVQLVGCCTGGTGALSVSGVDVAFKQIGR